MTMNYETSKRCFDIVFAFLGLLVCAPFFLPVAIAIKLTSPGPVFYRAERTGRFGKKFKIIKFRTMNVGSDILSGTTARNDQRITSVGGFLRRHKIDEMPQLINVLCGEMSIVGPRPELPKYTAMYHGEYKDINLAKPGITDYASVEFFNMSDRITGEDPEASFRQNVLKRKNLLRLKYVREKSLIIDIKIVARTLVKLVFR